MYNKFPGAGRNSKVVGPVTKTCADGVIVGGVQVIPLLPLLLSLS